VKVKRPRMRSPKPLADLLDEGLKGLGLGDRLRELDIWRFWPEVVGETIASRAQPLRIINGVLTVAVSSGPWMQELSFLKSVMKQKLNSRLGSEIVQEIVLKSGKVVAPAVLSDDEPLPRKPLTARQLEQISEQASQIVDAETRDAFKSLMLASLETVRTAPAERKSSTK